MTDAPTHPAIPLIDSARVLAGNYDAWLCDIWGVIHNGRDAHDGAHQALSRFRAGGGSVVLITNAPRPWGDIVPQLARYGVAEDAWDAIVTSGDVTQALIRKAAGRRMFHLGPPRDEGIFDELNATFTGVDDAEIVINTGLFDDTTETPETYREMFSSLVERGVEMICANPDLVVERGEDIVYCAGALAALYAELGGGVIYAGKPYPPIYRQCFARIAQARGADVPLNRILAIGDGLKTDIAGATAAGIDALFVPSGIHLKPGEDRGSDALATLFGDVETKPVAAIQRLRW